MQAAFSRNVFQVASHYAWLTDPSLAQSWIGAVSCLSIGSSAVGLAQPVDGWGSTLTGAGGL